MQSKYNITVAKEFSSHLAINSEGEVPIFRCGLVFRLFLEPCCVGDPARHDCAVALV